MSSLIWTGPDRVVVGLGSMVKGREFTPRSEQEQKQFIDMKWAKLAKRERGKSE